MTFASKNHLTERTYALVLAGGRSRRLRQLTDWRAKPVLPFGGKFNIIDFALSMNRPYKEAWPIEQIMAHIQADAGVHFDPELVQHFIRILPEILEIQRRWEDADIKREETV